MTKVKTDSLVTRVLAALKGGDHGKLTRFSIQVDKQIASQKALRIKQMEEIDEHISDINDQLKEAGDNINMEALKDIDSTKSEAHVFIGRLNILLGKIEEYETAKEDLQKQIDRLDAIDAVAFAK